MNNVKLNQLKKIYSKHDHLFEKQISVEEWEKLNKPCIWWTVEIDGEYNVLLDIAHDRIALFKNDEYIDSSKVAIISDNIVVLDKNYYPVKKYIWR